MTLQEAFHEKETYYLRHKLTTWPKERVQLELCRADSMSLTVNRQVTMGTSALPLTNVRTLINLQIHYPCKGGYI